jgi:hypothetical protein
MVRVTKRSGSRNLRISISAAGEVKVNIPSWAPYQQGVDFALSKADWILHHVPDKPAPLQEGDRIGKTHRLRFVSAAIDSPTARTYGTEIRVTKPNGVATSRADVQKAAHRASIRALRSQAESLLPQRLRTLAERYGFEYGSVSIRQLKGRWGSCDNKQNIVLNLFLMQLPWELIDYVLIHELTHTKHLNHGADFWDEFTSHMPDAKALRTRIHARKPILQPSAA